MPQFCVNKNAQPNGHHEVHDLSPAQNCQHLPDRKNQIALGWFSDCVGAVKKAKEKYPATANGCYYCAYECDTDHKAKDKAKDQRSN